MEQSIRINVIGRRDRLSESLLRSIEQSERMSAAVRRDAPAHRGRLLLSVQHHARPRAAPPRDPNLDAEGFDACCMRSITARIAAGEVDLLIRTGSEQRLSDFLLWECAYAELHFADCLWPDFDEVAIPTGAARISPAGSAASAR